MKSKSLSKISRLLVALLIASMLTPVLAFAADFRNVTYDGDTVRGSVYVSVNDGVYGETVGISVYNDVYHVATATNTTYSVYGDYYVYDFSVQTGTYSSLELRSVADSVYQVTYSAPEPQPIAVTGVQLDQTTMTLTAGGAAGTLAATVTPSDATNQNVSWSSSDESVATVVNGQVTPLTAGTTTITVTTEDGGFSATSEVTVNPTPPSPITPLAPFVTADDVNNVIVDADDTMEYSTDGEMTWTGYDPYDPPTFPGNVTVYVRVADDGFNLAGESTVLTFTANTPTPTPEPTTPPEPTPTPTPTPTPSNPAPEPTPGTPTPEPTPANPTPTPSTPTPTPGSPTPAPTAPPTTSPDPGPSNPTPAPTAPPTSNPTPTPSSPTPTPTTPTGPTPTPTAPPADNSFINIKVADLIAALLKAIEEVKAAGIPHFSDTDSHWAQSNISVFTQIGAIDGYEDGTFRPDTSVTRAEFAAILARVFSFTGTGSKFSDVTGHWAQDEIAALAASGIIDGYEDGTFQPNKTITRAEIISMVSKMVNLAKAKQVSDTTFHDTSGVWNADQIDQAAKAGIINGREAGAFAPNAFSTRAEALTIILNVLELSPELKAIIEKLR